MHRYLAGASVLATLALGSCEGNTGPENRDLIVTASSDDFGVVSVGTQTSPVAFTVTNGRSDANTVASVQLSGPAMGEFVVAGDTCTGVELAIQGACEVHIRLKPTTSGKKEATLTVTDRHGSRTTAALAGTATGGALRTNSAFEFPAAPVGTQGESRAVRVTNGGFAPTGPLAVALTAGDVNDFQIVSDACAGIQLPPTVDCIITIRFTPGAAGRRTATLRVTGDPGGTVAPSLSGTSGTPVTLAVGPATRDFGPTNVGAVSARMAFTVTNTGGVTSGVLSERMTGDASDQFRIRSSTCAGRTLPAAGACQVLVELEPTVIGPKAAVLRVEDPFGSVGSAELTGSGQIISLAVVPETIVFPPTMAASSSVPIAVTVTNTGTGTSSGLSVFDSGCYYYGPCDTYLITDDLCSENQLAPGATCTFALVFRPSFDPAATTITVASIGTAAQVFVSGTATGLHLPVQQVDFPQTPIGSRSAVQTLTVTNTGASASGTISTLLDRPDFEVTSNGCAGTQLPAGGSCTIQVRFRAIDAGLVQGSISISAVPGGWRAVTLRGTGT